MNLTVRIHNILFLLVYSSVSGFIMYSIFNYLEYWKPILSGVLFGLFTMCCVLPIIITKIKEEEVGLK